MLRLQSLDKGSVFGTAQSLLKHLVNSGMIAAEKSLAIEPKTGKGLALDDARLRTQALVLAVAQDKPVEGLIFDPPHDVFLDAMAFVDFEFCTEVQADGAGGNFGDK